MPGLGLLSSALKSCSAMMAFSTHPVNFPMQVSWSSSCFQLSVLRQKSMTLLLKLSLSAICMFYYYQQCINSVEILLIQIVCRALYSFYLDYFLECHLSLMDLANLCYIFNLNHMGNKILGKRSRSFYKGFNERQLAYLRDKFQSLSEKEVLKKEIFVEAYKINDQIYSAFLAEADFEEGGSIDQYQFICAVSYLCNLTVEELGQKFFKMLTGKNNQKGLKQTELEAFTSMCLLYNAYIDKKPPPDKAQIKKINKKKFQKYDYDKSKSIQQSEFAKICMKDEDYKNWLYNMGFITKMQMDFQDQIYDLVDSDVGEEVDRHLNETNPNVDRIKRGVQHRMQGDDQFQLQEVVGDQFTPIDKPWKVDTKHFKSTDFDAKIQPNAPSQFLTLDYVLGYRSFDCRNNLKFDNKDRIIYHQAALGIVMTERLNRKQNEPQFDQSYINQHKDDVSCLDIAGSTVATGEVGTKPMIILWETNKKQDGLLHSSMMISKELTNSVATLCFSPSQKLLAATCNDEDHKLVIYNLNELKELQKNLTSTKTGIICKGPLTKSLVFDIKFTLDQKTLVAATVKQLLFVSFQSGIINSSRGDFGNFSTTMALCLLPLKIDYKKQKKDVMLTGMGNGSVYFWEKDKCIKAVVGHSGSVSSICARTDVKSFISGDKSGKIIVWNDKFQKQQEINLKQLNKNYPSLMIVALAQNSKRQILIGTKSSHVYLMKIGDSIQKAKVVMSGHSQGTLWAMAIHRSQPFLYTGGEDQRLIKWDYVNTKKIVNEVKTSYKIRSLDYNQFCKLLVVGFYNGIIQCYNPDTLEKIQKLVYNKIKNPDQQALNIVKFEHYGKYIGACYSLPTFKFIVMAINQKQIKPILTIDFKEKIFSFDFTKSKSEEQKFVRINTVSGRYEIYNISKDKGEKVDNKNKKFVNIAWDSHTLPYTPQLNGLYSTGIQEEDIICCARNEYYGNVILVGDKYSKIKLFNYPSLSNMIYNKYEGHSNAITAIQFAPKEKYAISLGGQQKSILIWKFDPVLTENEYLLEQQRVDSDDQLLNEKVRSLKKAANEDEDDEGKQVTSAEKANATDHFKGQIKVPSKFVANPKKDNVPPSQKLQIHHVFGIRNKYLKDEVRNQGKFSSDCQHILFPTACMAIKMSIQTRDQQIFMEHKEDIVSFAVDRKRELMATGQMAEKNLVNPLKKILTICVWDIENKKLLQKLNGFHTIAIVLLEFSPSGKLLFTCGNDEKNTFAVYDWKAGTILYSGPVSKGKVNGISWRNELQFMTCGNDHVKLWTQSKSQMGSFPGNKSEGQICCISSSDSIYLTGGAKGNIYSWSGNTASAPIAAHEGKVQCLYKKQYFIYSGGDDGLIKKWRRQTNGSVKNCELFIDSRSAFANRKTVTLTNQQFGILSMDFASEQSDQLLFITKGCSAVHNNKNKFKIVTQGHYKGELWGLGTNPSAPVFVTGGDDKSVRCWDIESKQQIKRVNYQNKIRALDWSNDGKKIVVADSKAIIYYYDYSLNFFQQYRGKPYENNAPKKNSTGTEIQGWVEQIKFSPNSQYVVYGTHGKSRVLQFLKVEDKKISKHKQFNGGTSAILHIDWSRDSDRISYNTQAHQLLLNDINGQLVSASSVKDQPWASWTQKFGFPVQGIYQNADYSDINTVCRDPTSTFIAVGYDDQIIRTFKYPCYIPKQLCNEYYGHSSHVTKIRFCREYMVSLGGEDKTIIVWKYDQLKQSKMNKVQVDEQESDGLEDFDDDVDVPMKVLQKRKQKPKVQQFFEAEDEGDEFMAVKPWLGAIKQPTYLFPKQTAEPPKVGIKLQYVHGYRTKDCRQNLYYSSPKVLIYHAAAVLIYHNTEDNTQNLFTDHNDDILSIDFNRKTGSVMTGQLGPNPIVNYYVNQSLVHTFKGPVKKGVLACAINPESSLGVCAGMDDDHLVTLLDLKKGNIIASKKGGKKVILKLGWVNDDEFVSIGIKHFKYWTVQKGSLTFKEGKTQEILVSLAIDQKKGLVLAGASGGRIFSCKNGDIKLIKTLQYAYKPGPKEKQQYKSTSVVESLTIQQEFIGAGTKDGFIFILNKSFDVISMLDLKAKLNQSKLHSYNPSVRSLDYLGSKLLVGTFASQIFEIDIPNITKAFESAEKSDGVKKHPITKPSSIINHMKCHYSPNNTWTNEVWGLAISGDLVFTCSDDATVRCWSLSKRKLMSSASLNIMDSKDSRQFFQIQMDKKTNDFVEGSKGRSVLITPDNKFVIVGSKDGRVRIFSFNPKTCEMKCKVTFKHAKQWISDIKFGYNLLLIGSHDNAIYVYDYDEETGDFKRKYRPLQKHSSYITHMDVSRDSCFLQSTCGAYELLFWDLNTGKQITSGASMLKDERWATWTCNLGWPVQGIYPKCTDGTFIHSVDRSNTNIKNETYKTDERTPYLLAGGNNNGKVCIYNFPCTIKNSGFVEGKGHSSHITNVRWNETDDYIVSVGGQDQCLMYWRVTK